MQQEHILHVQRTTIHTEVKEAITSFELKNQPLSLVGLIIAPLCQK